MCFASLGPSWGSSWSAYGSSLGSLGPSWGHLERIRALLGCLGGILQPGLGSEAVMEVLGSLMEAPWPPRDPPGVGVVQWWAVREPEGGGPLEDYRNLARKPLAFLHASTRRRGGG